MIELSDAAASILTRGNQTRYFRVESWYGDQLLDDDVPIIGGGEEVDRSLNVPERVTLSVPRTSRGVDYTPIADDAPLAANGQRLKITIGVGIGLNEIEWLQRGWFVITKAEPQGDTIEVEAAGLLWLIQEARFVNPYQPAGSFITTIRGLLEPALTVVFDDTLVDRVVPGSINYDEDRLGAVNATLDAWPAEGHVTEDGYYVVAPAADAADVALALTDGTGGTVITASGSSSRDNVYNAVVAAGTAADGSVVRGVAYDTTGPKRIGSPFNDLPVPLFFDSPLLTTNDMAQAAADTRLATIKRNTVQMYDVMMVPHPGLQAADRVTLTTRVLTAAPAIVEKLNLPYLPDGGAQSLSVRLL